MTIKKLVELLQPYSNLKDADIQLGCWDHDNQRIENFDVAAIKVELDPDGDLIRVVLEAE